MIGPIWGLLSQAQKARVLTEVGKLEAKNFTTYREALNKAFDFRKLRPTDRLMVYQQRLEDVWERLKEYDLRLFDTQMADWKKLELNRMNKEYSAFNPFRQTADDSIRSVPMSNDPLQGSL